MLPESRPTGGRLQLLQEKLALRATESLATKWALELRDLLFQQNSQLTEFKLKSKALLSYKCQVSFYAD